MGHHEAGNPILIRSYWQLEVSSYQPFVEQPACEWRAPRLPDRYHTRRERRKESAAKLLFCGAV